MRPNVGVESINSRVWIKNPYICLIIQGYRHLVGIDFIIRLPILWRCPSLQTHFHHIHVTLGKAEVSSLFFNGLWQNRQFIGCSEES